MLELRGATSNYIPQLKKVNSYTGLVTCKLHRPFKNFQCACYAIRLPLPNAFVISDFSESRCLALKCIIDLPVFLSDVTPIGLQAYSHTVSVYYCTQKVCAFQYNQLCATGLLLRVSLFPIVITNNQQCSV